MPEFMRNQWFTSPMMRGGDVALAQQQLIRFGAAIACDGVFGRATRDAVLAFQRRNTALTEDGVIGRHTWAVLFGELAPVLPDRQAEDVFGANGRAALAQMHGYYAIGVQWQLGPNGVTIQGEAAPAYGQDEIDRVDRVFADYGDALTTVLSKVTVPVELVVACICVESSGNARAERHEKGCSTVDPALTPSRVSVGLMQTLLSTATSVMPKPVSLADLRDPLISIEAGATYMWRQARATHFDPPLVACAYNAGSLRYNGSAANRWKLVQYPIGTSAYADRFVRFFNAAMNTPALRAKVSALSGRIASF